MQTSSILGRAVKRVEDPRFLTGKGRYLPNKTIHGALHLVAVRSPLASGRILSIDTEEAAAAPGVVGVFTASDLKAKPMPPPMHSLPRETSRPVIASETVRFAGEIVAVLVAESPVQAEDAANLVWVDIEPLEPVIDVHRAARDDSPLLYPELGTNVIYRKDAEPVPDLFDDAAVVVKGVFRNQRLAAMPMEPNSAVAVPTLSGVELWTGSQNVFGHQRDVARSLGMDRAGIRTIVPDMGGGFGAKFRTYPEQVIVAELARRLERPVAWFEGRRENLMGMYQGRDQWQHVELGAASDGKLVGLRAEIYQDAGAYSAFGPWLPELTVQMACGVYDIPRVELSFKSVATNTTPTDAYRGAGRPEAASMIERAIDLLAAEMEIDPVELRRMNYISPASFPFRTPTKALYDTGDYEAALDTAIEVAGYEELRAEQRRRRESGDRLQLGIGVSSYVEVTAYRGDSEWSSVEIHEDGTATVKVGTSSHGQGHETAFSQLISDLLRIPMEAITVIQGDTATIERGSGTGGSRSLQIGGSAALRSGEAVLDKAREIVGKHYEAAADDIVLTETGLLAVAGVPDTGLAWGEVALLSIAGPGEVGEEEARLIGEADFETDEATYPFGTHISVVEVDVETGSTRVLRHIAVDDCGNILNPILVDGQVHGGVAQGYGQALSESVEHDQDGNLLTGTLVSYLIPTAETMPSIEVRHTTTPTTLNPLGVKGIGEAGTIGSTPAAQNAVIDAVSHLGVRHIDMPATPARIWKAIQDARAAG